MSVPFHIIATGSKGNAVVIKDNILIDCGVPYKSIKPYEPLLKLVLLTHVHGDHFNRYTIRMLSLNRPTLRFACCEWLVKELLNAGVPAKNIDVLQPDIMYGYGICNIIPISLSHDVPNCGYKIHFPEGKVIYATDTKNMNGINAPNYDLYLIEANYEDGEIQRRISEKKAEGQYAYERRAMQNHLSKARCDDFIYRNIGTTGSYVYMHRHVNEEQQTLQGGKEHGIA